MGKKDKKKDKAPKLDEATLAEFRRQQQIAAKAELRRRVEEEGKNTKINKLKITNQWRKVMRLAKTESLKKDIEILSQNHERDVDRKDAILQMLDRDLEEAEDQYQMAYRTHLVNVDTLIKLHDTRLYTLERAFQQELKTLQNDFFNEKDTLSNKYRQEKKDLQSIISEIEHEEEERENEARHAFEQLREEIRNRNLEDINMLRISLDAQIEELEQQFETAHLNYLQQTAQRTHDFKELTQNDQRLSQDIDHKKKAIDSLQTSIQHWRAKTRHLNRETEERTKLLTDEKMSIQRHYHLLKQRIQTYRVSQNQRLLQLSQSANTCKDKLTEKMELSKRILQISELSRKMETSLELILPFVPNEVTDQNENNNALVQLSTVNEENKIMDDLVENEISKTEAKNIKLNNYQPPIHQSSVWAPNDTAVAPTDRLTNFYRRYNKILLDNIAIEKEKARLQSENAQLEDLIKQFTDGTKVTESTLREDNPLFVVNGRANLNYQAPPRNVKPTMQEANLIQVFASKQMGPSRR